MRVVGNQSSPHAHRTRRFPALNWVNRVPVPVNISTDWILVIVQWGSGPFVLLDDPSLTALAQELGLFQKGGENQLFDLFIVGGGPAGLAGASINHFVARGGGDRGFSHVDQGTRRIPADFVFALTGGVPDTEWLRQPEAPDKHAARVARDRAGFVLTEQIPRPYPRKYKPNGEEDPDTENQRPKILAFQTSEEGLFAAGDVRAASVQRIAQAAGEGTASTVSTDARLRRGDNVGLVLGDPVSRAYKYYQPAGK
ncbi:hypothetical protein GCM10007079_08950 [Nocardiopsis terrae]|uniref:FAD/NAD(P)-binding domain-containing protein n=1 Tax=Nocardiopsis terrae TaxID=372655 RepID=A0ABR9HCY4_9ACTN|nr:hypothetical protein [Nocardiopsis terrae]MBE1456888.1 hypothetical protein [Nocardiopsis terrae]GHC74584.1 hypothetical protein GCM10007079_08950 [Nocardiopsis terrae]